MECALLFRMYPFQLLGNDRLARTYAGAGAAVDTFVGVDYIDVASRNSLYGALADASTACYARVGNFVSHCNDSLLLSVCCKYRNLFDNIKTRVGNQCLGDADAFGCLIVLKQSGDNARQSQRRTVQSVCQLYLLLIISVAELESVGLE